VSDVPPLDRPQPWAGYRLWLHYGEVDGHPAIVGVELWGVEPQPRPWPHQDDPHVVEVQGWDTLPDQPVTADALRGLLLGAALNAHVAYQHALARAAVNLGTDAEVAAAYAARFGPPKRGRPPLTDEFLRLVADAYTEAALRPSGGDTRYRLSRVLRQPVSPSTVRRWVKVARERALLDPAPARKQTGGTER
jgi:hypothetical protein